MENDMKTMRIVAIALAIASLTTLAGCGGVEGTYTLDKAETKKTAEASVAKLPAAEQELAKMALASIDKTEITLEVQKEGKINMKATVHAFDPSRPPRTDEQSG